MGSTLLNPDTSKKGGRLRELVTDNQFWPSKPA